MHCVCTKKKKGTSQQTPAFQAKRLAVEPAKYHCPQQLGWAGDTHCNREINTAQLQKENALMKKHPIA
jgi:hypothetical protein